MHANNYHFSLKHQNCSALDLSSLSKQQIKAVQKSFIFKWASAKVQQMYWYSMFRHMFHFAITGLILTVMFTSLPYSKYNWFEKTNFAQIVENEIHARALNKSSILEHDVFSEILSKYMKQRQGTQPVELAKLLKTMSTVSTLIVNKKADVQVGYSPIFSD